MHHRPPTLSLLILVLLSSSTDALAIVIRHDLEASLYTTEGDKYPEVMTVLAESGSAPAERAPLYATLLSPSWALSVAHGAEAFSTASLRVDVAGKVYDNVKVDHWFPHPCFTHAEDSIDLALIHFPDPPWPAKAHYPRLYDASDELSKVLILVGRGAHGHGIQALQEGADYGPLLNATNTVEHVDPHRLAFTFHGPGDDKVSPLEGLSAHDERGSPALMCAELSLDPMGRIVCTGELSLLGIHTLQHEPVNQGEIRYGDQAHYTRVASQRAWIRHAMQYASPGTCEDAIALSVATERVPEILHSGCQAAPSPSPRALLMLLAFSALMMLTRLRHAEGRRTQPKKNRSYHYERPWF